MEIKKLERWLEANGWNYGQKKGRLRITNPHFGTSREYPLQVIEESTLQNIILPHFLEGWHRSGRKGEYLGPHHVNV